MTSRRWLLMVFSVLLVALLVGLAAMMWAVRIVRSEEFLALFPDPFVVTLDAAYRPFEPACEVVVFGDSTAVTGVDPRVIETATGMRTCNVAVPAPVVSALGTKTVDAFLATHPKPKVLVVQINPDNLWAHPDNWDSITGFYPESILLRHHPGSETDWALILHPVHTFVFLESVLQAKYFPSREKLATFATDNAASLAVYRDSRGLLTLHSEPEVACKNRTPAPYAKSTPDGAWVKAVRAKYEAQGIRTLIRSSDIPACDPTAEVFTAAYAKMVDAPQRTLPVGMFNDADRHFTAEGARVNSLEIAEMIGKARE